jgi:hypothetical protein
VFVHKDKATKLPRRGTAAEAASVVRSGNWIDYGVTLCQPDVFDAALAARGTELWNVKIRSCISMRPRAVLESDPKRERSSGLAGIFQATIEKSMMSE